jgi:hypothetical protein
VTKTASGETAHVEPATPVDLAQREAQLDEIEARLLAQLEQRPPPLPEIPTFEPVPEPRAQKARKATATKAPPVKRTVVVRRAAAPPPEQGHEREEAYEAGEHDYEEEHEYEGGEDDD